MKPSAGGGRVAAFGFYCSNLLGLPLFVCLYSFLDLFYLALFLDLACFMIIYEFYLLKKNKKKLAFTTIIACSAPKYFDRSHSFYHCKTL